MADVDINPFGNHDKTDSHPDETGETIPFTLGGVIEGGSTWKLECEQETSFRGRTDLGTEVLREQAKELYHVLHEYLGQTSETFHFDDFEPIDGELYYKGKST